MDLTYDSIGAAVAVFLVLVLPTVLIANEVWRELVSFLRNWR